MCHKKKETNSFQSVVHTDNKKKTPISIILFRGELTNNGASPSPLNKTRNKPALNGTFKPHPENRPCFLHLRQNRTQNCSFPAQLPPTERDPLIGKLVQFPPLSTSQRKHNLSQTFFYLNFLLVLFFSLLLSASGPCNRLHIFPLRCRAVYWKTNFKEYIYKSFLNLSLYGVRTAFELKKDWDAKRASKEYKKYGYIAALKRKASPQLQNRISKTYFIVFWSKLWI